jgi:hypothetical protein
LHYEVSIQARVRLEVVVVFVAAKLHDTAYPLTSFKFDIFIEFHYLYVFSSYYAHAIRCFKDSLSAEAYLKPHIAELILDETKASSPRSPLTQGGIVEEAESISSPTGSSRKKRTKCHLSVRV